MKTQFGRLGIDGVGLLGGSLGMALRTHGLSECVVGIGRSRERLQRASERGQVDEILTHDALVGAPWDILVLAAPVDRIAPCLERHLAAGLITEETVVTDVGSTKQGVVDLCSDVLGDLADRMVGAHPIAGSEKSGAEHAFTALYQGRLTVLTPRKTTNPDALQRARNLWESVGSRTITMTPEEHDAILGVSSHLPHVACVALCAMVEKLGDDAKPILGTGFWDATRLASGSPEMWRDISLHNRDSLSKAIEDLSEHLRDVAEIVREGGSDRLLQYFQDHKEWRDRALLEREQNNS